VNLLEIAVIISTMKLVYTSVAAVMALFFVPASPADGLPDLGDVSATVLSPLDEKKIADQIMRSVMASDDVERDPEVQDYVQQLGMRLVAASSTSCCRSSFLW
jgi:beta-barrel assembly-enhancing protease